MILDFNSRDLKFRLKDIGKYDLDVIYHNIEMFKKFVNDSVLSETFNKVYKTQLFQITLLDSTTCYLDNLLITYNAIAAVQKLPQINLRDLKRFLLAKGFSIIKTTRSSYGKSENAYRVHKEQLW